MLARAFSADRSALLVCWLHKGAYKMACRTTCRNFLRCAGRENGAFRRGWFLRGGGARKKAAGTSKKCAWSRSERQPFCGRLALNDWRGEAAQVAASAQCARVCPLCAHMLTATGICGALQGGFQGGSESMRSLFSASLGASTCCRPIVPHLFCALRSWRTVRRASFCGP